MVNINQNNQRKRALIILSTILMCCLVALLWITIQSNVTASAFTVNENYTVTHTTDDPFVESVGNWDYSTYTVKGTVEEFGIAVNGKVHGNANVASTITVNGALYIGAIGESKDTTNTNGMLTGKKYYYLYYGNGISDWNRCLSGSDITSKRVILDPLIISNTTDSMKMYTFVVAEVNVNLVTGLETINYVSAPLTVKLMPAADTVENPSKTGYTFTGWYLDEECTELFEGDTFTENLTLYAGFRPNTYTVVFNKNNSKATGTMLNQAMVYDETVALERLNFVLTGYTFKGWARTSTATTAEFLDEADVSNLTTQDGATIHLYAVWEAKTYTISYVSSGNTVSTQTAHYDENIILYNGSACVKAGYEFIGWTTVNGGTTVEYEPGESVVNIGEPNKTITLYAVFEIKQVFITFIVDGEVLTILAVDYNTPVSDVISQVVDPTLYVVDEEEGELPLE